MKTALSQDTACHKALVSLFTSRSLPQACKINDAHEIVLATNYFGSTLICLINSSTLCKQDSQFTKIFASLTDVNKKLMLLGINRWYKITLKQHRYERNQLIMFRAIAPVKIKKNDYL